MKSVLDPVDPWENQRGDSKSAISIRHDLARWQRTVGNCYSFGDSQLEDPGREASGNAVNRDLCHHAARNNDRLRALSDRIKPSAHGVSATPSVVRQVSAMTPWICDDADRVISRVVDDG